MNLSSTAGVRLSARRLAFTLVELLVVMSIAVLVIGLAIPATNSLLGGRAVEKSINDISGVIEYARAEAMARRTYVYVVFANATNSDNNTELRVATAVSKNGLDVQGGNLLPLSRLIKLPNVMSTNYDQMPTAIQKFIYDTASDLKAPENYVTSRSGFNTTANPPVEFKVAGQKFDKESYFTFSPEGEITSGDPYNLMFQTFISVGLSPTRGTNVQTNAKDAAVVTVYGSSAKLRITRP